jgi:hypothetical protein
MRTGRVGYACAHAIRDTVGSAAAPAARWRNWRRGSFMPTTLLQPLRESIALFNRQEAAAVQYFNPANARSGSRADVSSTSPPVSDSPAAPPAHASFEIGIFSCGPIGDIGTACGDTPRSRIVDQVGNRRLNTRSPFTSWRSRTHEEPQVERCEHKDDADIHHQSFPESVSEERKIYTDYNGYHHHRVEHPNYSSVHFSTTSRSSAVMRTHRSP